MWTYVQCISLHRWVLYIGAKVKSAEQTLAVVTFRNVRELQATRVSIIWHCVIVKHRPVESSSKKGQGSSWTVAPAEQQQIALINYLVIYFCFPSY
jgi:hypothetical protein